ncbi:alpha/beta hydrolase [Candidatus Microgenomates bacterium]|nr:alpha/beta hydrolase [Candidatus Microgenomates bacterium]
MKKPTILILHGWGVNGMVYQEVKELLQKSGFSVFAPDLPGFGGQPLPKVALTLDDYLTFTKSFIRKNIKGKYIMIGHSFGGRIAILLASLQPKNLTGLVLTGAAGIRHPLPLRSQIAFFLAKYAGWVRSDFLRKLLYRVAGEFDYYKAGKLKKTFQNVIVKDLSDYLPKIMIPVLLVWGENDFIIPPADGEYMRQKIKNSKLILVLGARHNFPYTMPHVFVEKILPFLEK